MINNLDDIDISFMQRVQDEVTVSCALPFAIPVERIPSFIIQAAQWFWMNDDYSVEERMYFVNNSDICTSDKLNKIIKLPQQIMAVQGVYKIKSGLKYGAMGDFSIERMMMSSYSMFGGAGVVGGGFVGTNGMTGYTLTDVVTALYEVDTFNQTLNAPLTFNYNKFSNKLVLLGDLGGQNLLINCWTRCKIQELYNNYYFFRFVVCLVKRSLSTIYGSFEFKLPGGVTINYSNFSEEASTELDEIKEWVKEQHSNDIIMMPNTL